ncbi:hypothetical protein [Acinetobacter calcoaceticus]|uniref:hypothetical protein n=1 Tax=Acinetobacter calcoaceticus TaxID=471 RepID=UPI00192AE273|nr:hypothetical protein [Acinetobacter calcoaceticus]
MNVEVHPTLEEILTHLNESREKYTGERDPTIIFMAKSGYDFLINTQKICPVYTFISEINNKPVLLGFGAKIIITKHITLNSRYGWAHESDFEDEIEPKYQKYLDEYVNYLKTAD